ncbi:hypothetical protein D1632_15500 [Chryseobacterium nematophagum]|uniref:Phage tail tape measure protein domain-containing protein n=1 Tax=Chryseobacterium nematophagum TaxID=2305228 RepID=A0A3M7L9S0_9FLAO|nr:phage tail tape measure protein [Chryseobacterium nematophagum]RMZ58969.1 hypothetical protein D1632_15500 [Chryseobacterium nematophagum]
MNQNIDLGTFTWDTTKLSDQIAANYLAMQRLSGAIRDANKVIKQSGDTIKEYEKKIESEQRSQERLTVQLENGYITQEKYNEEIEKSNQLIDGFIDQQQDAIRTQSNYAVEVTRSQQQLREMRQEQTELNNLMSAGRTEIQGNEGAYKELNRELSALKIEAKNLGAEMIKLEQSGKKNTEEYRNLASRLAEVTVEEQMLNEQLANLDSSLGDNQRNVGNYKEAISSAFAEISQGSLQMLSGNTQEGFNSVKNGFKGIYDNARMLISFLISNPLTGVLVGILAIGAGIYQGASYMIQYNESIKENIKLTQDLTGTLGKAADNIRVKAQALSETFGDDFGEVLKTANTLAKQLGVTYEEAFDKIEQGYIRGANANGDFLDRLSEYGPLLNKYGFDLEEIIGLQIQAQQQGLFGDKFEDSIKEAGLSLEEFTKAQSDAISNAFGKTFSDRISHDVNSGVITVKDALILMSAEAKKQGLSVQQFGILTADVFKGAGEDIGGARVLFENIYQGIDNLQEPLTKVQQKTLDLSKANYELAKAKDDALKSDSLMEFISNMNLFLIKTETVFYKFIGIVTEVIGWIDQLTGSSELFGEIWDALSQYANQLWKAVEAVVDVFNDLFEALGLSNNETQSYIKSILKVLNPLHLLKFSIEAITLGFKTFSAVIQSSRISLTAFAVSIKSIFTQLVSAAKSFMSLDFEGGLSTLKNINISKEFANARKEAERIVALNKTQKIDPPNKVKDLSFVNDKNQSTTQADRDAAAKAAEEARKKAEADIKRGENKRIADAKKSAVDAKKALEEEAKRELEIAKVAAEQKSDLAKTELAEYILNNAEKYKNDKTLLKSKLDDQKTYFDTVRKLQEQINNQEEFAKIFAVQQKIDELNKKKELNQNDLNEIRNLNIEIENIHKEYSNKDIELTHQTNEKKKELDKNYEEQVLEQRKLARAIDFQQNILDLEDGHASEYVIKQVQLDEDTQQKLDQFLKENELKRELDQEDYDINTEINAQRKELENQLAIIDDENEKLRIENQLGQISIIEQQYAQSRKQIDDSITQSKLEGFATVFGAAKQAFGDQTAVGKAAAIAETTINTYKAAQSAYSALAGIPVVGPALGGAAAAFAVITGLKNVQKIVSTKDTFASGGLIQGASHSSGGVPIMTPQGMIEAEGGEVIINKVSSRLFRNELSAINQAGGGAKFAAGGIVGSNLASVQNLFKINTPNITLEQDAISQITSAIYSGSQSGISDMADSRKIQQGASF